MNWLFIFFIFMNGSQGFALEPDFTASGLYEATKEACLAVPEEVVTKYQLELDNLHAGRFPSQRFTLLLSTIRGESFQSSAFKLDLLTRNPKVEYILRSADFQKALMECYPNSPTLRAFFENSVIRSEKAGKTLGVAAILLTTKGVGSFVSFIGRWAQLAKATLMNIDRTFTVMTLATLLTSDSSESSVKTEPENNLSAEIQSLSSEKNQEIKETAETNFLQSLHSLKEMNQAVLKNLVEKLAVEENPSMRKQLLERQTSTQQTLAKIEEQLKNP